MEKFYSFYGPLEDNVITHDTQFWYAVDEHGRTYRSVNNGWKFYDPKTFYKSLAKTNHCTFQDIIELISNGKIILIPGNYEREGKYDLPDDVILGENIYKLNGKYTLSHEPLKIKSQEGYKLFGHIHGRQKIKPWEGLDVGVDGHNYKPVSEEEAQFYLEAIKKGYYDEEVFC